MTVLYDTFEQFYLVFALDIITMRRGGWDIAVCRALLNKIAERTSDE